LADLPGGVSHDAPQDVLKLLLGIDSQVAAGLDEGEDGGVGLAAVLAANEEPVLAPDGERANTPFRHVVVEAGIGVFEVV